MYDLESDKNYVIFAIDEDRRSELENYIAYDKIDHKRLEGMYKNELEFPYLVKEEDFANIELLFDIVETQESFLWLGPKDKLSRRIARLEFKDHVEEMGRFVSVPKKEAFANGDYTYDPSTNIYFICTTDLD